MPQKQKKNPNQQKQTKRDDSFESTARRLECDQDLKKFDQQLRKIATAKVSPRGNRK